MFYPVNQAKTLKNLPNDEERVKSPTFLVFIVNK